MLSHRNDKDLQELSDLLNKLKSQDTVEFPKQDGSGKYSGPVLANKGRPIAVIQDKGLDAMYLGMSEQSPYRGAIMLGPKDGKSVFLHELGHATGLGKNMDAMSAIYRLGQASKKVDVGELLGACYLVHMRLMQTMTQLCLRE